VRPQRDPLDAVSIMVKYSPPQLRRGGRDIKKKARSDLLWSGRGGADQEILVNTTRLRG
jgi:hypothetical protein